jgi:hypothetical protein
MANLDAMFNRLSPLVLVCGVLMLPPATVNAAASFGEDILNLKLGGFLSEFDTVAGVTGPNGGDPKLDFEDLGLDSDQTSFRGELMWRFASRHRVILGYYSFERSGTADAQERIEIDDPDEGLIVIDAGVSVDSEFDWRLVPLSYAYSFYKTDELELAGSLGVHWVDVKLGVSGIATLNGVSDQFVAESESASGPLPVLGLRADYAITPRWLLGGHAQYFGLDYDDYSGDLLDLRLHTEYWFTDSFSAGVGYTWYNINVTNDLGSGYELDVEYNYNGLEAFVGFRF